MANVKIPYALIPAVALDRRREQMVSAMARGLPRLKRAPVNDAKTLYVACYGPSLRETWRDLIGKRPIISMSGATKFLAERGIIADYAIEMDPRPSQLTVSLPPVKGVHYLIGSVVVPEYFDRVLANGNPVTLWHPVSSNWNDDLAWLSQHDEGELLISTGSTVGLAAIQVGGVLGFTRFEIHAMDGSFAEDGVRHAATHGGKEQFPKITWNVFRKTYYTSKIMANAVAETVNTAKNFPIITVWHGNGLTQALIRKANLPNAACADESQKVERLRGLRPMVMQTPTIPIKGQRTFWDAMLDFLQPGDLPELVRNLAICEPRRASAKYNTGSIPFEAAAYLRAISRFYEPKVVVEVGTFIGTSLLALKAGRVTYTCDWSNNCVPSTESVITHPFQRSTQMLAEIQEKADLFFFDGRIQKADLDHIVRLSHPGTVFIVDDYTGNEKGVVNIHLLAPYFPTYTLITPGPGPSTLAVLLPLAQRQQAA